MRTMVLWRGQLSRPGRGSDAPKSWCGASPDLTGVGTVGRFVIPGLTRYRGIKWGHGSPAH